MENIRVRFAPSPTGYLHLGSARTALFNWLYARHMGGALVLRIEDTDPERSSAECEATILSDLKWLGLDWDEGPDREGPHAPYRQSERRRSTSGKRAAWRRRAWSISVTAPRRSSRPRSSAPWPRAARPLSRRYLPQPYGAGPRALQGGREKSRPALPRPRRPHRIPGHATRQNHLFFGGHRRLRHPALRRLGRLQFLSVVVDDAAMGITHVVRGRTISPTRPARCCSSGRSVAAVPLFAHHSLLMGGDGAKLSKRHGATAVREFHAAGYLPQAIVNYLALLSWSPEEEGRGASLPELVGEFRLETPLTQPLRLRRAQAELAERSAHPADRPGSPGGVGAAFRRSGGATPSLSRWSSPSGTTWNG